MFIELTLTGGRGYVLIDPNKVTAVSKVNGMTEIYCVGSDNACFQVEEDARYILDLIVDHN